MKNKKVKNICIKCGEKGKLNMHGVCSECEKYDQNKTITTWKN
jgi:NMD protein affecting ribosome stability and mRNA decay